ncbi:hypothetical protein SAMN02910339_02021 [Lachnospiraceae bacterium YSD2013]|jgi:hypothetical protein|nr:hypothetical protein [Lachnospiraceae bacterium]SCX14608.1 hypothetical protein SAMN02910339_02021 [Lachnospiraceae bacterium YSD2013]
MAEEKKERKIVKVEKTEDGKTIKEAKPVGNAGGLRCGAIICWLVAICFEVLGFLLYFDKIRLPLPTLAGIIGVLVLDLIFVIIGSQLWKKANRIDPASKKNPVKFFLWNNMGVIVCIIAFLPYIILIFTDKQNKLDKKTKAIAVVVGIIALLIGGLCSYDWNPISSEEKAAAEAAITGEVYWTQFGKVYHTSADCSHLNNSDTLYEGDVDQAIADNKTRLCKTCAKRDNIEAEGIKLEDGEADE